MTPTFQHLPLAALLDPAALTGTAALYYRHLHWLMQATAVVRPMVERMANEAIQDFQAGRVQPIDQLQ